MKKFVPLLLCFSLSLFTVASATKPGHTLAAIETAQKHAKAESLDVSESDDNEAAGEQDTDQESHLMTTAALRIPPTNKPRRRAMTVLPMTTAPMMREETTVAETTAIRLVR